MILDTRPVAEYRAGHAPGAVWLDAGVWEKAFGDGDDAAGWSKRIGGLGVTATTPVVVYDASRAKDAALPDDSTVRAIAESSSLRPAGTTSSIVTRNSRKVRISTAGWRLTG